MIDSIWARLFIVLAIIGAIKWGHYVIDAGGYDRCTAENATNVVDAVKEAREKDKKKQEIADAATKKQIEEERRINRKLLTAYNKLRDRADRAAGRAQPKPSCKGATGADLSRQDGEFLIGEAARADTIRAGLEACYEYESIISNKQGEQ